MQRLISNQAGDTIVEVLIAMAVLGAILVGGYAIATSSLNRVRASQERGEALRIAESQVEALRVMTSKITDKVAQADQVKAITISSPEPGGKNVFCVTQSSDGIFKYTNADSVNPSSFNAGCQRGGRYDVVVTNHLAHLGSDPSKDPLEVVYDVHVYWDRSGGGQKQNLSLKYKVVL